MNFIFRVDSSSQIGSGHIVRCLTLAKELNKRDNKCKFICRDHNNNLIKEIEKENFEVITLYNSNKLRTAKKNNTKHSNYYNWIGASWKEDANQTIDVLKSEEVDLLIIDHYGIDQKWEKKIRPYIKKIMVIDDLANRKHYCDLLLDQNLGSSKKRYKNLIPKYSKQLHGPLYALINSNYSLKRTKLKKRSAKIKRVLIYFGNGEETFKLLKTTLIAFSSQDLLKMKLDIVFNGKFNDLKKLRRLTTKRVKTQIYTNLPNLSSLMSKADLAIGAAGSTSWERCCMGLPTIGVISAENQKFVAKSLNLNGVAIVLHPSLFSVSKISKTVMSLYNDESYYLRISKKAFSICDGNGSKRVAKQIMRNLR